jgi:hypothetical protein
LTITPYTRAMIRVSRERLSFMDLLFGHMTKTKKPVPGIRLD